MLCTVRITPCVSAPAHKPQLQHLDSLPPLGKQQILGQKPARLTWNTFLVPFTVLPSNFKKSADQFLCKPENKTCCSSDKSTKSRNSTLKMIGVWVCWAFFFFFLGVFLLPEWEAFSSSHRSHMKRNFPSGVQDVCLGVGLFCCLSVGRCWTCQHRFPRAPHRMRGVCPPWISRCSGVSPNASSHR